MQKYFIYLTPYKYQSQPVHILTVTGGDFEHWGDFEQFG